MAHGRNKYQSRENRARVRRILLHDWDPIGIQDIPEASDEYDRYADKAYVMLMDERATADRIAAYLYEIAAEHMGLGQHQRLAEASKNVAEALVTLRPEFETD
jgi:GTPase SAR1 family protein